MRLQIVKNVAVCRHFAWFHLPKHSKWKILLKHCLFLKWRRKPHFLQLWLWCNGCEKSRKLVCCYNFLREENSFKSWILLQCSFQKKCLSRIFLFECFGRWNHAKWRHAATFLTIWKRKRCVYNSYDSIWFLAALFHE